MRLERLAPAKVNLFLHVGALGDDGYHPLSSLMTFADVGDMLTLDTWPDMAFEIDGPMAEGLSADGDNLVTRARDRLIAAVRRDWKPFRLALDKRLPIAAGVGGGSADAAAALALIGEAFHVPANDTERDAVWRIAGELGADVPVCLLGEPRLAEGRGDLFDFPPVFPDLDAVLVNPGVPCPTGAVFRAYDDDGASGGADTPDFPPPMDSVEAVARFLLTTRNDLQPPAVRLVPQIGEALAALDREPESLIARMSGSGATCFALCWDLRAAHDLAARLTDAHPGWWVQPCRLKGFRP